MIRCLIVAWLGLLVGVMLFGCNYSVLHAVSGPAPHERRWEWQGVPGPRCAEALLAEAQATAPCLAGVPVHGFVRWRAAPFDCDGRKVWGCSTPGKAWVEAWVALPPSGHVADSAAAEEIAHWVWGRCFPLVLTEWKAPDPATGKLIQMRDPAFRSWYDAANFNTRKVCP